MDYQEAFSVIVNKYGFEILDNSFLVRSFLLDYLGNKVDSTSLVDAYYTLNMKGCIYQNIKSLSLGDAKKHIKGVIKVSSSDITPITYIRSVEPLLILIYGDEYQKVGEVKKIQKVNVVRIRKKTEHSQPLLVNSPPPQVINTPAHNAIKKRKVERKLFINFSCSNLKVHFIDGKKIELVDEKGNLINQRMTAQINGNKYSFFYSDSYARLIFNIPRDIFSSIYICLNGTYLEFEDKEDKTKFKSIDINANCSYLFISNMKSKSININASGTYVSLSGGYKKVTINDRNGSVDCYIDNVVKSVKINTSFGNINLNVGYEKVYPRINHFLQKVSSVNKTYWFAAREVELKLSANYGKIKVY